jgi:hypothetical protein
MAPGVVGGFVSTNPYFHYAAGPGGLVTGNSGLYVGRFAWVSHTTHDWDGGPAIANNFGSGPVTGFVHRQQRALITTFLDESTLLIPKGFNVDLLTGGDIFIKNDGVNEAWPGQYVYASFTDGKATFGSSATGGSGTASSIAAASGQTVTGSIADDVLTVTAAPNTVVVGAILTGTGITTGTQIVSQLSGTAGGVGTYRVNIAEQTVASATVTQTYGTLTVGGTVTGAFAVGQTISGSGVTTGTYITALGTGTGGAGTYIVSPTQTAGSTTISSATSVLTKWFAVSSGLAGEIVKCSSQPLG